MIFAPFCLDLDEIGSFRIWGHILNIKYPCLLILKSNNLESQYEKWFFYSSSSKHIALVGTGYDFEGVGGNLFGKVSADARAPFCSEYVFLGWKVQCAEELAVDLFKWLLDIKEVPLPSELQTIGIYEEEGTRIF